MKNTSLETEPSNKAEIGAMTAALYGNSFKSMHPAVQATGFRTHGLRYRTLSHSNHARVAEDFLVNSRCHRNDTETQLSIQNYFLDPGIEMLALVGKREGSILGEVRLPEGVELRRGLGEAIARRRSRRIYTGDPIELRYLATILRGAGSLTGHVTVELLDGRERRLHFRAAPSGGGLYPIEIHFASLKIADLDRGLYRYDPIRDVVSRTGGETEVARILKAFTVPDELISITQANLLILLVGHPWQSMRKYGARGLRYVFIEAGAIAENIHLVTEGVGYGSVDCASVIDDEVHEALSFDGLFKTLLHTIVIGYPG